MLEILKQKSNIDIKIEIESPLGFYIYLSQMKLMRNQVLVFVLLLVFTFQSCSVAQINHAAWNEKECLKHAQIAFQLQDLSNGKVLEKLNEQQLLAPASTAKMLTVATALHFLGDTFKTKTQVFLMGKMLNNGLWKGNLVFKGLGDMGLTLNDENNIIKQTIDQLKSQGIFTIEGEIIVDPFYFEYNEKLIPSGYTWEDMGNYFASPASAFSLNNNSFSIFFKKGTKDDIAQIESISPALVGSFFDLKSTVTYGTAQSGDQAWIYSAPLANSIFINGTIPEGANNFEIKGSLPNPAAFFAEYFLNELNINGISVNGKSSVKPIETGSGQLIVNYPSAPLSEWIKEVNQNSNNFYAEMLLCHLGASIGKPNYSGGIELIFQYVKEIMNDNTPLVIRDGSGLSPINVQSVAFQNQLLMMMKNNTSFINSLSVSGELGTLKNSFNQPELKGKLKGKSGSIAGVLAYSFYFESKSGKQLVCSFIVNHHQCKSTDLKEMIANQIIKWKKEH